MGQEISRKEAGAARGQSKNIVATGTLDATTTQEIVVLPIAASKITVQSTGDLAGTFEVSINGSDWESSTAFLDGVMGSYSTHIVGSVRVTRTGGSGKLIIAAVR